MKVRWWALILFIIVHLFGMFLIFTYNQYKDFFGMIIGVIIVFSPPELYPKMYKESE